MSAAPENHPGGALPLTRGLVLPCRVPYDPMPLPGVPRVGWAYWFGQSAGPRPADGLACVPGFPLCPSACPSAFPSAFLSACVAKSPAQSSVARNDANDTGPLLKPSPKVRPRSGVGSSVAGSQQLPERTRAFQERCGMLWNAPGLPFQSILGRCATSSDVLSHVGAFCHTLGRPGAFWRGFRIALAQAAARKKQDSRTMVP